MSNAPQRYNSGAYTRIAHMRQAAWFVGGGGGGGGGGGSSSREGLAVSGGDTLNISITLDAMRGVHLSAERDPSS